MAKQCGPIFITGCIDDLQFYKMDGEYYVRLKSSLSGKRVKTDKAFTLTMINAHRLGNASTIASRIYSQIPKEERKHEFFNQLTGIVIRMLQQGLSAEDAYTTLYEQCFTTKVCAEEPVLRVSFRFPYQRTKIFSNHRVLNTSESMAHAKSPPGGEVINN